MHLKCNQSKLYFINVVSSLQIRPPSVLMFFPKCENHGDLISLKLF